MIEFGDSRSETRANASESVRKTICYPWLAGEINVFLTPLPYLLRCRRKSSVSREAVSDHEALPTSDVVQPELARRTPHAGYVVTRS